MQETEHTIAALDVKPFLNNPTVRNDPVTGLPLVHVMLPLNAGEEWRARVLPMITHGEDDARAWSHVASGACVRVPLWPYRIGKDLTDAFMGIFELAQSLTESCTGAVRTHVVIGTPVQDLSDEGHNNYRVWLGFAARMK